MTTLFDQPTETLVPGLYNDVGEEYYEIDAMSNSKLSLIEKKHPAYMKWRLENPKETDAMSLGSAIHAALLEPEHYQSHYKASVPPHNHDNWRHEKTARLTAEGLSIEEVADEVGVKPGTIKKYFEIDDVAQTLAHYQQYPPSRYPCPSADDIAEVDAICEVVMDHPTAAALLTLPGSRELSALWKWRDIFCKAKIDLLTDSGIIVDVKTINDASTESIERTIWDRGYHRQLAFYEWGLAKLGVDVEDHLLIFVETTEPYGVRVIRPPAETLKAGWRQIEDLSDMYYEATTTNEYKAYSEDVEEIGIPYWAHNKLKVT